MKLWNTVLGISKIDINIWLKIYIFCLKFQSGKLLLSQIRGKGKPTFFSFQTVWFTSYLISTPISIREERSKVVIGPISNSFKLIKGFKAQYLTLTAGQETSASINAKHVFLIWRTYLQSRATANLFILDYFKMKHAFRIYICSYLSTKKMKKLHLQIGNDNYSKEKIEDVWIQDIGNKRGYVIPNLNIIYFVYFANKLYCTTLQRLN